MKKLFAKLKTFIDVWKMWLFFGALLAGTNGAQMYVNSERTSEKTAKTASTPIKPQKTVIIRKVDNKACKDLLKEHETGDRH